MTLLDASRHTKSGYSAAEIEARNEAALARSAAVRTEPDATIVRAIRGDNHILLIGGPPATTAGSAPNTGREVSGDGSRLPVAATLTPVATEEVLHDEPPGDVEAEGADRVLDAALAIVRALSAPAGTDPGDQRFIGTSIAGPAFAPSSSGLSARVEAAVRQARAASSDAGRPYTVAGLFLLRDVDDRAGESGEEVAADLRAAALRGAAGQASPPVVITHPAAPRPVDPPVPADPSAFASPGGAPAPYLAVPFRPVAEGPDQRAGSAASRWLGAQFGKVWHEVVVAGHGWRPTSPVRATWRDEIVLIECHVPRPPLRFLAFGTAAMPRHKGFSVRDRDGEVAIVAVEIAAAALVAVTCVRTLAAPVVVAYGQGGASDLGSLCDSDETRAPDGVAGPSPVGIADPAAPPDALRNWCVAFVVEAEAEPRLPDPADEARRRARLMELATHEPAFAPSAVAPRRAGMARLPWPARLLAGVGASMILDLAWTASGRYQGEEIVPQIVGQDIFYQKRCRYRISVVETARFPGEPRPDAAAAGKDPCPKTYR